MTLKEAREAREMSQAQLAARVLVDQSAVSNWERGINPPLKKYRKTIARVLGVKEDDIEWRKGNAP